MKRVTKQSNHNSDSQTNPDLRRSTDFPQNDFGDLLRHIQQTRQKIFSSINTDLIELYRYLGETISQKVESQVWGKGVVDELAKYIAKNDPDIKGFSDKNLWRMKKFFETYQGDEKLSALLRQLPWTQNTIIFSRCKTAAEREFYINSCIQERFSSRELERQITASQFERSTMGHQKLSAVLRELHPDISIGVLLCRDKDDEVVEYALSRNLSPTLIAKYQLQLPDKKLIQAKLHELCTNAKNLDDEE